ncbi:MAG: hypothetical protein HYV97_11775 [Bdellovibrio sp.]|nr:hypothetical protein [Bdellovibrio sp.]
MAISIKVIFATLSGILATAILMAVPSAMAISLPDSVSKADLGLNAVREFSQNGPIPNRKCASVMEEHFKEFHGVDDIWGHNKKKKNPFRDQYLRMRNYAIGRLDCRAYVEGESELCESSDCRAILNQDQSQCESNDCKALLSHTPDLCENQICHAFVTRTPSECSGDCAAYLRNNPSLCETQDCRAYLERRSLHCTSNICFALVQKETFFCFREED